MPFSICVKSELSFKVIKTKNTNKEHCHISGCKKEKKKKTTAQLPSDTNYFIYAKCHIRKKPLLTGKQSPFCVTYTHSFFDIKHFVRP